MRLHINDWTVEEDNIPDGGGDASDVGGIGGTGGVRSELADFIAQTGIKVLAMLGQEHDEVGVTLVTDADMQQMNREHRGIDAPTDVLSFALDDDAPGDVAIASGDVASGDIATGHVTLANLPHLVGDIIISVERAEAQSEEYGHSLQREIGFLLIHGLLHLYGYDHIDEQDRIAMRAEEERILAVLGLGRDVPETPHNS
jgi:probable rRNA maturation factor